MEGRFGPRDDEGVAACRAPIFSIRPPTRTKLTTIRRSRWKPGDRFARHCHDQCCTPEPATRRSGTRRADPSARAALFHESFEPVRQFRPSVTLVRELSHQETQRLNVPRDSQRPGVHWIETGVPDQSGRDVFRAVVVPAVDQAWSLAADRRVPLASNTPNSTSLGTVPNADTIRARGTFLASFSAPEEV